MTVGTGVKETSRDVDECFMWKSQRLKVFCAVSDAHLWKVKLNDD